MKSEKYSKAFSFVNTTQAEKLTKQNPENELK